MTTATSTEAVPGEPDEFDPLISATSTAALSAPGCCPRTRSPRWHRELLGALAWLSLLVVTALWVQQGGLRAIGSPGEALTSLGRLTGLLASDLLLLQILLMARIPWLERSYGQDGLVRSHRAVGSGSFTFMAGHIVLIVLGYADASPARVWEAFWDAVLNLPAMLLALAGTVLLVLVGISSARRARSRMRYESWHLLHLYAYLGCFLALPHQLWTGADFLASPWATAYWWSLWLVAVAAILTFRVGLPLWRSRRHALVVSDVTDEGHGISTITMTGRDLHRLAAAPGQFFNWRFLDGPGWTRANPYSLSGVPDGRSLRISVAAVGDGSIRAARVRPGTRVLFEGPYGRLHPGVRTSSQVTLIAAGIGIAPMLSLLEGFAQERRGQDEPTLRSVTLLWRIHERASAALFNRVCATAPACGTRLLILEGPRDHDRVSWLPTGWQHVSDSAGLRHLVPNIAEHDVYVCGAPGWMNAVEDALGDAGVDRERIHLERFAY